MMKVSKEDLKMYEAICNMEELPSAGGGEGRAYFVDDNYVLKRYYKRLSPDFDNIFESYCSEMKKFAENGYNVPKIYAWTKMPNFNIMVSPEQRYDYYILEERIKGRQIFYGQLENIYPICENLCEKDEFLSAIKNPENNKTLFLEILKNYVDDFQNVNEYLNSISEYEIDKFLYDTYTMCIDGKFSVPDIFPGNILIDKDKFTIIDNRLIKKDDPKYADKSFPDTVMTSGILWLFFYNSFITNRNEFDKNNYNFDMRSYFIANREKVTKPCKEAMLRMVKRMNAVCMKPKMTNKMAATRDFIMIRDMLSVEDALEVFGNMELEL